MRSPALDEDLATLGEVLLGEVGLLAEQHHAVPLGFLLPAAVAVGTALVRRDVEVGDGELALGVADLGVAAEVTEAMTRLRLMECSVGALWMKGAQRRGFFRTAAA